MTTKTVAQTLAALESILREGGAQSPAVAQAIVDLVDARVQEAEAKACDRLRRIGAAIADTTGGP